MPQYMTGRPRSTRSQFHLGNQKLLRAATPEELEQWSDASNEDSYFSDDLIDLDEGRPYIFEVRNVLTRSDLRKLSSDRTRVFRKATLPGFEQQKEPGASVL